MYLGSTALLDAHCTSSQMLLNVAVIEDNRARPWNMVVLRACGTSAVTLDESHFPGVPRSCAFVVCFDVIAFARCISRLAGCMRDLASNHPTSCALDEGGSTSVEWVLAHKLHRVFSCHLRRCQQPIDQPQPPQTPASSFCLLPTAEDHHAPPEPKQRQGLFQRLLWVIDCRAVCRLLLLLGAPQATERATR